MDWIKRWGWRELPLRKLRPRPKSFEEQIYAALLHPGDVCFDVGANEGDVAVFMARLVGSAGMVVSFEPVWPTFTRLCGRTQNGFFLKAPIVPMWAGLSDSARDATIQIPAGDFAMGSLARAEDWSAAIKGAEIRSYPARFITLDALLASTKISVPQFMKIDVEGAELLVLQGAAKMFSSHRPLMLIEVFAPWERAFGYRPWDVLSWLRERGYKFLFACPTGLVECDPSPEAPFPEQFRAGYNVVTYVPAAHASRVQLLAHLIGAHASPLHMPPPPYNNA
jgi:FkbM family methyltransferase